MTVVFIPIALITSMVGLASILAGAHHVRVWRSESLAAASATSLIAWFLTLLAMGIACKEVHTGYGRSKRLVSSQLSSGLHTIHSAGPDLPYFSNDCVQAYSFNNILFRFSQKTLEAFMIILSLFELLYLLTLHAGSASSEGQKNTPATPKAVKDPNFGNPAATAV